MNSQDSILGFYESLAADYDLQFKDWRKTVVKQGLALDTLIRKVLERQTGASDLSVLDCSAGIGTQAIGLALRGYRVHATDLSPTAIERASAEAKRFNVALTTGVADMRRLSDQVAGSFDVVISCDNAIPHLLTDDDLNAATKCMASRLSPGGLFLASQRDYDELGKVRPESTPLVATGQDEDRRVSFQLWDWSEDGKTYEFEHFLLTRAGGQWSTRTRRGRYRALTRTQLERSLVLAGLGDLRWHAPEETGYHQPVITARR